MFQLHRITHADDLFGDLKDLVFRVGDAPAKRWTCLLLAAMASSALIAF